MALVGVWIVGSRMEEKVRTRTVCLTSPIHVRRSTIPHTMRRGMAVAKHSVGHGRKETCERGGRTSNVTFPRSGSRTSKQKTRTWNTNAVANPAAARLSEQVKDASPKDAPLPSLFPKEPAKRKQNEPVLNVAVIGGGLAGLSTAVELLDQGHHVEVYESRPFIGGKVASFQDRNGNHVEMGLHVFFGCYFNLFRLLAKCGAVDNLLVKDHTHTFCNENGDVKELDFRFFLNNLKIGAPFHGLKAFFTTPQLTVQDKAQNALALAFSPVVKALVDPEGALKDIRNLDNVSFSEWFIGNGGSRGSIDKMWDPIAYALGFIDCDNISARCMLTIFQFFATKTDASVLRMLCGSPENFLVGPIVKYIEERGGKVHTRWGCREIQYEMDGSGTPVVKGLRLTKSGQEKIITADAYVAALDVPGAKRLIPEEWRQFSLFDNIYKLVGVPVCTVQLRYDGWVTEMKDATLKRQVGSREAAPPQGIDNLLYSADVDYSCFADLALTSPEDYYKDGEGSLMQCVLTPADPYMPMTNDEIIQKVHEQTMKLFPSARDLTLKWGNVVKISQSLYREAPGMDPFRPDQTTPVPNFFLAGSYTKQDYIDSMEGATLSGRQCAAAVTESIPKILSLKESKEIVIA